MKKYSPDLAFSVVLSVILTLGIQTFSSTGIATSMPFAESISRIVGFPSLLLIRVLGLVIPAVGYLAFEPFVYVVIGIVWVAIFFEFFTLCRRSLHGRNLRIAQAIPLIFVLIAMIPVFRVPHAQEDAVEACLSGRNAEAQNMSEEGARYCMRATLQNMLGTESGADLVAFCASLSSEKIAAYHRSEAAIVAPNTTYRDSCFISLGLARIASLRQPDASAEQQQQSIAAIIQEVCDASRKASGSAQKEAECVQHLQKSKGLYY